MFRDYRTLSKKERRAAKKLANELIVSTAPCGIFALEALPEIPNGAVCSAIMQPENIEGILVYSDGGKNWWGDVVFRRGNDYIQIGTPQTKPKSSYEVALEYPRKVISIIKLIKETGVARELRESGYDPSIFNVLEIHSLGRIVYIPCLFDRIGSNADLFDERMNAWNQAKMIEKLEAADASVLKQFRRYVDSRGNIQYEGLNFGAIGLDMVKFARELVLERVRNAREHKSEDRLSNIMVPDDELCQAVAFLLAEDVTYIDDEQGEINPELSTGTIH
jgi:hypothetical protein